MSRRSQYPRRRRPNYRRDYYPPSQGLDSRVMELENKKLSISLKSNDQGYFFTFLETAQNDSVRGKVTMSAEKAEEFRSILNEFVAEYERLPAEETSEESKTLKSESFSQGKRIFYVDLRQNIHGRFLKVSAVTNSKSFVAIPGNYITAFRDNLVSLLDENSDKFEEERAGGGEKVSPPSRAPPPQQVSQSGADGINDSREVRAGNKRFIFDVAQNNRGIYIQLTEMLSGGRKNRINVPQGVWEEMGSTFSAVAKDYPMASGEESTSED